MSRAPRASMRDSLASVFTLRGDRDQVGRLGRVLIGYEIAPEADLEARVVAYLTRSPGASARSVARHVVGRDSEVYRVVRKLRGPGQRSAAPSPASEGPEAGGEELAS